MQNKKQLIDLQVVPVIDVVDKKVNGVMGMDLGLLQPKDPN